MGQAPVGGTGQDRRLSGVLQLVSGLLVLRSLGLLTSTQLAGCQVWAGLLRHVTTCRVSYSTGPAEAQSLPRLHACNHGCPNKVNSPGNWAVEVRGRQMTEASMADACRAHCQAVYCVLMYYCRAQVVRSAACCCRWLSFLCSAEISAHAARKQAARFTPCCSIL